MKFSSSRGLQCEHILANEKPVVETKPHGGL